MKEDLEERVNQFNSLSLPGQPMGMHMGTSYLVNDLWKEVQRLRASQPADQAGADGLCPCGAPATDQGLCSGCAPYAHEGQHRPLTSTIRNQEEPK